MGALYLSDADVQRLIDVRGVLDVVEDTFRAAHAARIQWPEPRLFRLNLDRPTRAKYHVKAAGLPDLGVVGVRVVGYRIFADDSGTSRDDNMRYVLLHDPESGHPLPSWTSTPATVSAAPPPAWWPRSIWRAPTRARWAWSGPAS